MCSHHPLSLTHFTLSLKCTSSKSESSVCYEADCNIVNWINFHLQDFVVISTTFRQTISPHLVDLQKEQLKILPTAGRPEQIVQTSRDLLRTLAVWAQKMVRTQTSLPLLKCRSLPESMVTSVSAKKCLCLLFENMYYKYTIKYMNKMLVIFTENYAQHWCSLLSDPSGVFASCHSEISPKTYKTVKWALLNYISKVFWIALNRTHLNDHMVKGILYLVEHVK